MLLAFGFYPNSVIYRGANALFAAQVSLRRLNGNMPQKKLVLLKLSARLFRFGLLIYGKRPGFAETLRWLRQAG